MKPMFEPIRKNIVFYIRSFPVFPLKHSIQCISCSSGREVEIKNNFELRENWESRKSLNTFVFSLKLFSLEMIGYTSTSRSKNMLYLERPSFIHSNVYTIIYMLTYIK